jgi:hypothetical protein
MTVGYYRLPSWAYGLEHQNTAPFSDRDSNIHDQLPPNPPLASAPKF